MQPLEPLPEVELPAQNNRPAMAIGYGLGVATMAIVFVLVNYLVWAPAKVRAAGQVNDLLQAQGIDDQRLLDAAEGRNDPPALKGILPAQGLQLIHTSPPKGMSEHEWTMRELTGALYAARTTIAGEKHSNEFCQAMLSVPQQADRVVASGGLSSQKGKQELAVLLDLIRPGLGRLVVPQ